VIALIVGVAHAAVAREDKRWLAAERAVAGAQVPVYPAPEPLYAEAPASRSFSREELAGLMTNPTAGGIRPVVIIDGEDGTLGAALLAGLRAARPGALLWPMALMRQRRRPC